MAQTTTLLSCNTTPSTSGLAIITQLNLSNKDGLIGLMDLNSTIQFGIDNPTVSGGTTITSITPELTGYVLDGVGVTLVIKFEILDSDGSQLYTENFGPNGTTNTTLNGTTRTTSDGSNAWTLSDVNGIQIKLSFIAQTADKFFYVDHAGVNMVLEEPPIIKGKIQHQSGLINHTSGKISLIDIP
mgnify:FL=1